MGMKVDVYSRDSTAIIIRTDGNSGWGYFLSESDQRQFLQWFKTNKPALVAELICEECPEVLK
jgi:hypothetical protein